LWFEPNVFAARNNSHCKKNGGLRDTVIDFGMMEMEFVTIRQRLATFVTLLKELQFYDGDKQTIKQSYKTRYERRPLWERVCQEYIEMYQLINKNES
jgi:glycogen synthase